MTPTPNPRVQGLPKIQDDLAHLTRFSKTIITALECPFDLSENLLLELTRTLSGIFDLLEALRPGLKALSLESLSEDE